MKFYTNILTWYLKKRIHQINFFIKYPIDKQYQVLNTITYQAKKTIYGKKYGFSSLNNNYENFKQQIPIVTYEKLYPYIKKIIQGENNITWPSNIKYFAKSSGTTNSNMKLIPISDESLHECHYKAGKDLISIYINNHPTSKILHFKNLRLGGSNKIINNKNNIKQGDLSAILIDNLPFWCERLSTPNKKISLISEWESKLDIISNEMIKENIVSLTGIPSWMLILLQKIKTKKKIKYLDNLWKNIEVFFHGGIHFDSYRYQYEKLFKNKIRYYEIYNASEGFFAIQDQSHTNDLLLLLDYGIFYEFISTFDLKNKQYNKTISIESVELHKNYALIISTNGGLWRYIIGDTIKFTSLYPHKIQITGRTKHYINAFGEELIIENANIALKNTCKKTHCSIKEYTAAPIFMKNNKNGAHQWIIEFFKPPKNLIFFSEILDQELKKVNCDYKNKRYKNIILNPPKIEIARKNLFLDWMKKNNKLGGQNKIPRLSNERKYVEDILKFNYIK